jgi:hypothetical protein
MTGIETTGFGAICGVAVCSRGRGTKKSLPTKPAGRPLLLTF